MVSILKTLTGAFHKWSNRIQFAVVIDAERFTAAADDHSPAL